MVEPELCDPSRLVLQNGITPNCKQNGIKNGYQVKSSEHQQHTKPVHDEEFEATPLFIAVITYISYAILIIFGYIRDLMRFYGLEKSRSYKELGNKVEKPAANLISLYINESGFLPYK